MDKRFWAFIGVIAVIFVGIIFFNSKKDSDTGNAQPTNHVMNTGGKITLTEYGDYQCPACGSYYPIVKQVVDKYKDSVTFQFRNLPLTQIHPNAFSGARAAEAAAKQNKFWEMHDILYENQSSWSESSNPMDEFKDYAKQLGLNVQQFQDDYKSKAVSGPINADIAAFKKTGATMQTPSFFIDGKHVDAKADVDVISKLLDEALNNKQ
jgi:protein-disulfide isomerase